MPNIDRMKIDANRMERVIAGGVLTEKALRAGDAPEIVFGRWVIDPDVFLPAHVHSADTIAYCVAGSCAFQIGENLDQRFEIGPGEYAYIPAGTVHTEITGPEGVELIFARDRQGGDTSQL